MEDKVWISEPPRECDLCHDEITTGFYDARVGKFWANLCPKCFLLAEGTLGVGHGQRYEKQENGRWLKTGG